VSTLAASALRTLAFGDLDAGLWGAAWGGADPFVAIGALDSADSSLGGLARIDGSSATDDWTVSGQGTELTVSPRSEPARSPEIDGFDQLCRVRGHFVLDGAEHQVDSLGRRGIRPELDLQAFETIRDVSAWFEPDEGIALTALRPRGVAGHDHDIVVASVFEAAGALPVADPRLSTTYTAGGRPVRAGVELWLGGEEDGEQQYPRRAGGEALGASASAKNGLDVQAHAFRWHSRGRDGAGVYLLVRTQ
jgi:hypothetical protein